MASPSPADLALVFQFVANGNALPKDFEIDESSDSGHVARYLAAAQRLKAMRLLAPVPAPADDEGGLPGFMRGMKRQKMSRATAAAYDDMLALSGGDGGGAASAADQAKAREQEATDRGTIEEACALIKRWRFGHEHVGDSRLLRSAEIWSTFLEGGMPLTAMIRNLGRMTCLGVLRDDPPDGGPSASSPHVAAVVTALTSPSAVSAARLHPITLLEAQRTYARGSGDKGALRWAPVPAVAAALEAAFYLAFKQIEPTGLRYLLGVDVSGSMDGARVCGMPALSSREAAVAVAMALLRVEGDGNTHCMAFAGGFSELPVRAGMPLEEVMHDMQTSGLSMSGTDCSKPMQYALQQHLPVDVFVVLTDNETYSGTVHPTVALREYRERMGRPDAKLIVLAFSATEFSIADPNDPSMMDIAGLDSAVPRIMRDFALGKL